MGDRAARWGGQCTVEPGADGGTHVRWSVPLRGGAVVDDPVEVTR